MTLIIGIDPDQQKNGVAFIQGGRIQSLHALNFFALQAVIDQHPDAIFAVEDVEANPPTFKRKLTPKANMKVSQDVGRVKGVANLIIQYLVEKDRRLHRVRPLKGQVKKAKDDGVYFNRLTGWEGKSNQDKRDAALVGLYGIKPGQYVPRPSEVPH